MHAILPIPMRFWPLVWGFFLPFGLLAQNLSGIVNQYAAVSAIDYCGGKLTVSDTAGFRPGGQIILIQMQGAEIESPNSPAFGNISDLKNAGRYERALVDSVAANAVFVRQRLVNQYDASGGAVQIVTFPVLANATLVAPVRAKPWDGTTGGIVALEVTGTLTMNAPIVADTCGFRGGANFVASDNNCYFLFAETEYAYALGNWRGAPKGEGIAAVLPGKELGRGAQANGGGGGNDHNSGGGGGANTASGGIGGENDEPSNFGCDGYYPGEAGKKITGAAGRIFLGGGGGAGHTNNLQRSAGGNGGGIVVLLAGTVTGSNPMISANGESAARAAGDGGGGGGAGGSILCKITNAPANLALTANGGKGGDTRTPNEERCFGPGGGGAGGRILTNQQAAATAIAGQPGIVFASTSPCLNTSVGAEAGEDGTVGNFANIPQGTEGFVPTVVAQQPENQLVCVDEVAVFTFAAAGPAGLQYRWQTNAGTGWMALADGGNIAGSNTPTLTIQPVAANQNGHQFRCQLISSGCVPKFTAAAQLTVNQPPTANFTFSQNGPVVSFAGQADNFDQTLWLFGDGASSTETSPTHTFAEGVFTVEFWAINACDTARSVQTITVLSVPTASFFVPDTVRGCGSATVVFQNQSSVNATTFAWQFSGGSPSISNDPNPLVTFTTSGNYTATLVAANGAGTATATRNFYVEILPDPTAAFGFVVGQPVQFTNQSTGAASFFWDFGDGQTSTAVAPAHTFLVEGEYTVTLLAINACDTARAEQTVAFFLPPTADFFVPDTISSCTSPVVVAFQNLSSPNSQVFIWSLPGGIPAISNAQDAIISYTNSGTYTASLTVGNPAGNDDVTKTFVIEIKPVPTANFNAQAGANGTFTFTNLSTGGDAFAWFFGDGSTSSEQNPAHQYAQIGAYTVTLQVLNACGVSVFQQTIEVTTVGTADFEAKNWVSIRPNPVGDWLTLVVSEAAPLPERVRMFDVAGRLVWDKPQPVNYLQVLDVAGLPAGTYLLEVVFPTGRAFLKFVKT
ncbi:MAG: PKD domain-containing protein [Saprospiraceae bacterium]